ncbi:MAG: transglutaminase TgpA family protein [Actinomycetota bacterium]
MSLWRDDPRPSPTTLATLIVVAVVAVASLSRVFDGPLYLAWALPAVAIGAGFALWFGRRSLGIGFLLLFGAWVLTLPFLFARADTAGGVPTAASLRAVWRLLGAGLRDVTRTVPPVQAHARFAILVWTAFLFLGFLGASWVVVRRPVGAIISALGVVTFSGSLGEGPGRSAYAMAVVGATGAFFLSEGRQRITRWAGGRIRLPAWFGIPTLGIACLAAAGAPLVIGDAPLVELRSAIRPRVVIIKPLSDIRRQLKVDPPIEVMRVTSDRSTYWRLTGLDEYDGREWVLQARPRPIRNGNVRPPRPPATGEVLDQTYRLTSLLSPWMPAAYAARSVQTGVNVEVDEGSQTLLLRDETQPGLAYTVRSQLPRITANAEADPRGVSDATERAFGEIARPIVSGTTTPLDIARRLENYFNGFAYNEDVDGGHSAARLERFLNERVGYCEQFAATMTLMLRGLGIEARVGVGFLPGAKTGTEYVVSTREAHAWVEANIPGAGWTPFDPTPGRPDAPPPPTEDQQSDPATPPPAPEPTTVPASTPQPQEFPRDVTQPDESNIPAGVIWAAVALAVLSAVPVTKRIRRSVREVGEPVDMIIGGYAELTDRARDLGWSPRPSETHREFLERAAGLDPAGAAIARLTARALYGPPGITPSEAAQVWTGLPAALAAMRDRSPRWRRIVAPFDPRSFFPQEMLRRVRFRVVAALGRSG